MSIERAEIATGVGAFIVAPTAPELGFVTVQETFTKRRTNKLRGMRSLPMETVEEGESQLEALRRLFEEELDLDPAPDKELLTQIKLNRAELSPGVVLHTYLIPVPADVRMRIGSAKNEVQDPTWTPFPTAVDHFLDKYLYRGGNVETIEDYAKYLASPDEFKPGEHPYTDLRDYVPSWVFDLIESGAAEAEPLFQWSQPSQLLAR